MIWHIIRHIVACIIARIIYHIICGIVCDILCWLGLTLCRFLGNYSALALTVPTGRTAMISDCCFDANIATEGGAGGVYLAGAGAVDVASCAFNRNYAAQSMYTRQSAGVWCAMSSGATAMFADCTFATNCVSDLSFGSFGMSGAAAVTVCRAKFTANKCVNPRADSWLAMTAAPSAPSA